MKGIQLFVAVAATAGLAQAQVFERLITSPFVPVPSRDTMAAAIADFDSDGRQDILLRGKPLTNGSLRVYRNDAIGRFVLVQTLPFAGYLDEQTTVGDFDGDGDPDVVIGDVLLRNDAGILQAVPTQLSPNPFAPPLATDLDGDGRDELLILGFFDGLRVFALAAGTTFVDETSAFLAVPVHGSGLAGLDADADGDRDIAMLGNGFAPLSGWLLRNDGAGHLTAELLPMPPSFLIAGNVHAGDFDGDGDDDLLALAVGRDYTLLANDGAGSFTLLPTTGGQQVTSTDLACAVGDWDLDGAHDLVTPEWAWSLQGTQFVPVAAFVPKLAAPLLADLDGDLDLDALSEYPLAVYNGTSQFDGHSHRPPVIEGPDLFSLAVVHSARSHRTAMAATTTLAFLDQEVPYTDYNPLRRIPLPMPASSVALLPVNPTFAPLGLCACTPSGPQFLMHQYDGTFADIWPLLGISIGAPQHVAAGGIGTWGAHDLAFGDMNHSGPRILIQGPFGYAEQVLLLPPSPPHAAPVFETVLIVDMDGDGDQDLVHELRVLHNDGGGQWSVGATLHNLVPATTERMLAIDHDGDGDRDLIAFGSLAATLLLQNDGTAFHDVTIGRVPPPAWQPTNMVSAGDVDGDGDEDLLLRRGSRSDLLRNDGGVFVRLADVGPAGVLLDTNFDDRPDLFTGGEVWLNRHALLHERQVPGPGVAWTLEVHSTQPGPSAQLAVLAVGSPAWSPIELPGIGLLEVDLGNSALVPMSLNGGYGESTFAIPLTPIVVGLTIAAQAVLVDGSSLTLTGMVIDRVR